MKKEKKQTKQKHEKRKPMSSELILLIILKNYGVEMAASVPLRRPPPIAIAPFKNTIKDKNSKMLQEKKSFLLSSDEFNFFPSF